MKIAAIQHVPTEPLGFFENFFLERQIPYEYIPLYKTNEIPRLDATHYIFLGGPMSVNDEQEFPYLKEEKNLIKRALKDKKKVLGICLGAQLIAVSGGAKVYRYVQETGWHTINCLPETNGTVFSKFPDQFSVFQLHGETFNIPFGGRLHCFGMTVKNQAFSYKTALGLQFHLELTPEIIHDWCRNMKRYQREKIERDTPRYIAKSNDLCRLIAEEFIR
jgi:GMP synthase-like glutamine amidotransferase